MNCSDWGDSRPWEEPRGTCHTPSSSPLYCQRLRKEHGRWWGLCPAPALPSSDQGWYTRVFSELELIGLT